MAARASRVENQDAIDAAIVGMLGDPKEACIVLQALSCTYAKKAVLDVFCQPLLR